MIKTHRLLLIALYAASWIFFGWPQVAAGDTVTRVIDRQLAVNTQNTVAWKEAASITLTQDGSWLVFTSFDFGIDSDWIEGEVRLQQDNTTELQYARIEGLETSAMYKSWFWMTRVERSGSDVQLDLDFEPTVAVTARIRNAVIAAIRLDDLGAEDTNWRWNENEAGQTDLGTTWTDAANILVTETWTPGISQDWLIIANMELTANVATRNGDGRLSLNDESSVYDTTTEEGVDTADWRWWSSVRLLTLAASAQKFEIQARSDFASETDARRARFFAVRKGVFEQVVEFRADTYASPSAADTWEEKLNASFTPNQSENVLILGHAGIDFGGTGRTGRTRVHEEETDELMYHDTVTPDSTDLAPVASADILNWDTSTHNADLDINASDTGVTFGDAAVIFVSLTLNEPPGAPTLYNVDSVQLCFNNAKLNDDTPTFRVAATDPQSDTVDYRIEIDDDAAFGSINWTRDFDNGGSHYTSGSLVNLTCSTLTGISGGTTYYVQVKAKDPTGSNTYSPYTSDTWSFTYNATAGDGPMWFQTTDEQFDTGTLVNTETTGSDSVQYQSSGGTITSPSIDYDSFDGATDWDWLEVNQDETNGNITYTIQYLSGTWQDTAIVDEAGIDSGGSTYIDLEGLTPATHNQIRIVATLTQVTGTPYLEDWTVTTIGAGPTIVDLLSFDAVGYQGKVLVKWETDSEIDNAGFNIYRSQDPDEGYIKINSHLIPGLGNSAVGREYEFWDCNVPDGNTYYYQLEDVEFDGKSTRHGPVEAHPGLDSDGDGMTDDWENYYGLNPYDPADASIDPDGDGFTHLEEFIQETDHTIPSEPLPPGGDEDGVKIIQTDDYGIVFEVITSSFDVETKLAGDKICQVLKLPYSHGQTDEVGKPQVPVKGVLLGIPYEAPISIELLSYDREILSGYDLYPVPRIYRGEKFPKGRILTRGKILGQSTYKYDKDPYTYSLDEFYPDYLAEVSPVGSLRRQDVAKLKIYPVQFNPVTGELVFYRKIRLRIDFGKKAEIDEENIQKLPASFNRLHKILLRNNEEIQRWRNKPRKYIGPTDFTLDAAYKILVKEEGIYRLTGQDLNEAGLNPNRLNPKKVKLYNQGKEIPIYVAVGKDGRWDYDDYIEFYAQRVENRYTSTNVYWLTPAGGKLGQRMKSISPRRAGQTPASFLFSTHHEENQMYWMDIPDVGYVDDHWFFNDLLWAPCSVDFTIPLNGVASSPEEVLIEVALQGVSHGISGPEHHSHIYLNGYLVDDTLWDGNIEYIREFYAPQDYLVEGDNTITIELPGDTGAELDLVLVNWFKIHYWRQFKAERNILRFNNQNQGRYSYKISGFTADDIEIFDITDPEIVKRIVRFDVEEADDLSYRVIFNDRLLREDNRDYLVLSSSAAKSPIRIVEYERSDLRSKENQADYIIITHEDFYDSVLPLADHRARQGLNVKLVKVEDIYDEFNYGIFGPEAIKNFLSYAYSQWREPSPTYVLLVGDGTYDYQDNESLGGKNYVPTYMVHSLEFGETGSDNWFVCLDGEEDILADMFIGRLPVYEVEQVDTIVEKIISYESTPSDDWTKEITLVADNLESDFVTISEELTDYLTFEHQINKIYLDDYIYPADCGADIIEAINRGTLILNYVGHGSVLRWAHESIFGIWDIPFLDNSDKLTFISTMTCGNGYFVYPAGHYNCMAEELLYSPFGAAVAILAPTGISHSNIQELLNKGLFEAIFVNDNLGIGEATTQGRLKVFENAGESGKNVIQTFLLFGDPALELKRSARK